MNVFDMTKEDFEKAPFEGKVLDEWWWEEKIKRIADHLISNGVTVQEYKVAEIDQFKLPIDDAILILKEEYKQGVDGYTTHLSYGDPAEEVHIDALGMAIAALELQKQAFSRRRKENKL